MYTIDLFNVAKCNLGKVNLEAMLVSCFPSYSRGGPMPLAGAPRDLYTQLLACSSSQSVVAIACCLRASLCFGFACLLFSACTMTARRTNNSLAARLDGENSSLDTLLQAESSGPLSLASAANSAPQTSSVSAPVVAADVHDPALIAAIVDAVKASLAAEKGPGSSSSNLRGNSDSVELQAASGGVPAPSSSLSQQTATFLASGGAFPEQQAISSPSATQGRPNFTVPSTSITAGASVPVPLTRCNKVVKLFEFLVCCPIVLSLVCPPPFPFRAWLGLIFKIAFCLPSSSSSPSCISS